MGNRTQNREIVMSVVLGSPATEDKAGYDAQTWLPLENCDLTRMPNLGGYEWDTVSASESFCNSGGSLNFDDKGDRKAIPTDCEVFYTELAAATVTALAAVETAEASASQVMGIKLALKDDGSVTGNIYQQFKVTSYKPENSAAKENRRIAFDLLPASVHVLAAP